MKFIIFLAAIALAQATQEYRVLKDNVLHPSELAIDYETNTLFFQYTFKVPGDAVLKSAMLNLNTLEFEDVSGMKQGFAHAYDRKNHIMYLGGEGGLYAYDYESKSAKNLGVTNNSIWQMFHSPIHGLYFVTLKPKEKAFVFSDGYVKPLPELNESKPRSIAITQNHNLLFANGTGGYVVLGLLGDDKDVQIHSLGDYKVIYFASDMNGKIYFSTLDTIYYVNEEARKMDKLVTAKDGWGIWGVAVAGDGRIVYALDGKIVIQNE